MNSIPAHFYSYSFEQWPHWSRDYPSAQEIHPYLVHCVEKYGLAPKIRYNTEIKEIRWNDERGVWKVSTMTEGKPVEREVSAVF